MKTNTLTILLQIAGVLHLGLLCAGAVMPRAVNLRAHLATLPPFIRRLFWVYYSFIALCLVSFGLITVTLAGTLAAGGTRPPPSAPSCPGFWPSPPAPPPLSSAARPNPPTNPRR